MIKIDKQNFKIETARIRPEQLTWAARHPETVFFCHDIDTFTKILGL